MQSSVELSRVTVRITRRRKTKSTTPPSPTTAVRRASVGYKHPLATKSIDVAQLPTKCGLNNEQGKSSKAGDQKHSLSERCRQRIDELPRDPRRLTCIEFPERCCPILAVATQLSRIGPGKLFQVPLVATFQSAGAERHWNWNRVSKFLGHVGRGRDAIERGTLLLVTTGISGRRELALISHETAPPPLRCIPWFWPTGRGVQSITDHGARLV